MNIFTNTNKISDKNTNTITDKITNTNTNKITNTITFVFSFCRRTAVQWCCSLDCINAMLQRKRSWGIIS